MVNDVSVYSFFRQEDPHYWESIKVDRQAVISTACLSRSVKRFNQCVFALKFQFPRPRTLSTHGSTGSPSFSLQKSTSTSRSGEQLTKLLRRTTGVRAALARRREDYGCKVSAPGTGYGYFDTIVYYGTIRAVLSDRYLIT